MENNLEQRIAIICDYNADKIKDIKELMEEDTIHFVQWVNRMVNMNQPLPVTAKGRYELYQQSKTK